jgi:hypothetical protein
VWSKVRRTGSRSFDFLGRISSIIAYDQGRVARSTRILAASTHYATMVICI